MTLSPEEEGRSQWLGHGLHLRPDMRRARYRMGDYLRERLGGSALPEELVLERGVILDQGPDGTCVGHAWTGWENCKPLGFARQQGHDYALGWYDEAVLYDPWPENDAPDRRFGTTTQAGVEVAIHRGLAQSYVWSSTLDEISAFIRSGEGPVVLGSYWYRSMFYPDARNFIPVNLPSGISGGHEWLIYGVQLYQGRPIFVCQQSWGESFADQGDMYFWPAGIQKLIDQGAEAVACVQTGVPPR